MVMQVPPASFQARLAILLVTVDAIAAVKAATSTALSGDIDIFDRIFASREPKILLDAESGGLVWTEGPVLLQDKLIFSDTIANRIYSLDLDQSKRLDIIRDNSGGSPPEDKHWRAEPGSNGIAQLTDAAGEHPNELLVCQHGGRRLSTLNLKTGTMDPIASEFKGRRLNGPNDVVVRTEKVEDDEDGQRTYAYFTDPVYAWLEKDRFQDLPYLDERVNSDGPGFCGVYRVDITDRPKNSMAEVELITSEMARPNGILFDEDDLIVSDCCQGKHLDGCTQGISRWNIFRQRVTRGDDDSSWLHSASIEDKVSPELSTGGCADGFAIYKMNDDSATYGRRRRREKHVLIASCFGGLCIVDLEVGEVVARLWTANEENGGCKISNVVIGETLAYLTGSCGIMTLPLRRKGESFGSPESDDETLHVEL